MACRIILLLLLLHGHRVETTLIKNLNVYFSQLTDDYLTEFKLKNLNRYRLGDVFKHSGNVEAEVCTFWPKSVGCAYTRMTDKPCQFKVLVDGLRNSKFHKFLLRKDVMIVHVRTGDALIHRSNNSGDCWNHSEDCLGSGTDWVYAYTKEYYATHIKTTDLKLINTIVIVTNPLHWTRTRDERDQMLSEDMRYLKAITSFFKGLKKNVDIFYKFPAHPDDDFYFLSSARNFVVGGGGFSHMVAATVILRGGKVYGVLHPNFFCRETFPVSLSTGVLNKLH